MSGVEWRCAVTEDEKKIRAIEILEHVYDPLIKPNGKETALELEKMALERLKKIFEEPDAGAPKKDETS